MNVPTWLWLATVALLVGLLAVDVFIIGRRPHEPTMRECVIAITFFVGLAILFGLGVLFFAGGRYAGEFYAGWLTEYSLSIDNLFVIIMAKFNVPRKYQQTALLVGIILALVMRGIFIALGAAAIQNFSWVFYIFGAFLIYTAFKLATQGESGEEDYEENRLQVGRAAVPRDPGVARRQADRQGQRQARDHADAHRHPRSRHHRPAVRTGLVPGDHHGHAGGDHDRQSGQGAPRPGGHQTHFRAETR